MSGYKIHFITGIVFAVVLVFLLNKTLPHIIPIHVIATLIPLTVISALLPDIDTNSRIRNITDIVFLIALITTFILGIITNHFIYYGISGIFAVLMISSRLAKHRGIYHSYWLHGLLGIGIGYIAGIWVLGAGYFVGFLSHKIMDKQKWL